MQPGKKFLLQLVIIFLLIGSIVFIIIKYYRFFIPVNLPAPTTITEVGKEETALPTAAAAPLEGHIGVVVDLTIQPDGRVEIIMDKKTYLLPASQKVKLYTSETESTSILIDQLKKGTTINIIKFTNPDRYEIYGTTDKALVNKLL